MHKIFRPFNLNGLPCRLVDAFLQKNGEVGVIVEFKFDKRVVKVSGWADKRVTKRGIVRHIVVDTEAVPISFKDDVEGVVEQYMVEAAITFGGHNRA